MYCHPHHEAIGVRRTSKNTLAVYRCKPSTPRLHHDFINSIYISSATCTPKLSKLSGRVVTCLGESHIDSFLLPPAWFLGIWSNFHPSLYFLCPSTSYPHPFLLLVHGRRVRLPEKSSTVWSIQECSTAFYYASGNSDQMRIGVRKYLFKFIIITST